MESRDVQKPPVWLRSGQQFIYCTYDYILDTLWINYEEAIADLKL